MRLPTHSPRVSVLPHSGGSGCWSAALAGVALACLPSPFSHRVVSFPPDFLEPASFAACFISRIGGRTSRRRSRVQKLAFPATPRKAATTAHAGIGSLFRVGFASHRLFSRKRRSERSVRVSGAKWSVEFCRTVVVPRGVQYERIVVYIRGSWGCPRSV